MLEERSVGAELEAGELRRRIATSVRELRTRAGRSLGDLAADAGIGKSTLHAIENGDANPGIETLWALARALGVPFGELLEPPAPAVRVVRAGEGPEVLSESGSMQAHLLATTGHRVRVEVYRLALEPGPSHQAAPHAGGTVEHVLVTAGGVSVGPTDAPVHLGAGDLATFPGDRPHAYEATEPGTRAVLLLEYATDPGRGPSPVEG
ncbi:MAG: helix-turn-helix domain-containing protein [Nitriliruptoraceae bacterium]